MLKLISLCLSLSLVWKVQAQSANTSTTRNFLWTYELPAKENRGPMDVQVKGTYYFRRESLGSKYLVYLVFKPGELKFLPQHGTRRYKYQGVIYREDEVNARDGLGSKGFDNFTITRVSISIEPLMLTNAKRVFIGDNIQVQVGETTKDANLNTLVLDVGNSRLVDLNYTGSTALEARLAALKKIGNDSKGSPSTGLAGNTANANKQPGSKPTNTTTAGTQERNYWNGQSSNQPARKESQASTPALKGQQELDQFRALQQKQQADLKAQREKTARDGALLSRSFYAAQARSEAGMALTDASKLAGTFESIEELDAAYHQQLQEINGLEQEYTDAGREKVSAEMDWAFKDADAKTAAFKNLATGLGQLASDAAAEKKAQQARQELAAARDRQERMIRERKWQATLQLRSLLLEKFPDGGVPLSFHKVQANELYYFAYVFSKDSLTSPRPRLLVSNVYRVDRSSDNTWPLKLTLLNELKRASGANKDVVMVGYYVSEAEVTQIRAKFLDVAGNSQLTVKPFQYKGKKRTGSIGAANDYWNGSNAKKARDTAVPNNYWQ